MGEGGGTIAGFGKHEYDPPVVNDGERLVIMLFAAGPLLLLSTALETPRNNFLLVQKRVAIATL